MPTFWEVTYQRGETMRGVFMYFCASFLDVVVSGLRLLEINLINYNFLRGKSSWKKKGGEGLPFVEILILTFFTKYYQVFLNFQI